MTESLSREIFDDEIFVDCKTEKDGENPKLNPSCESDKERSKVPPSPPLLDTDTLIIERKLKPQIKKKKSQREAKNEESQCIPQSEKPILPEVEKQLPNIEKEKPSPTITQREINAEEIAEAINKVFQKVDEENSTESSTSSQCKRI